MRGIHWTGERERVVGFGNRRELAVGSDPECDVCLPDPSLSRKHAAFVYDGGRFWVQDTNSSAGTFVRMRAPVILRPGDPPNRFKLGRTMVTLKVKHARGALQWRRGKG